jgi:protein-S-isoprenylcysteine O-methyltransferase Ste14
MAEAFLNCNRIRVGRFVLAAAFIVNVFTASHFPDTAFLHLIDDSLGLVLLGVCMLGRIYCTLQIGGRKNAELVTAGIYSVVRNPLYFFSFIGVVGIGIISNQITVFALLVSAFFMVYVPLIGREEKFLQDKFGPVFTDYMHRVPRLVPDFSLYVQPGEVTVNLRTLHDALRDALGWLVPYIVFETIEWAQQAGLIHPLASIW